MTQTLTPQRRGQLASDRMGRPTIDYRFDDVRVGWRGTLQELSHLTGISLNTLRARLKKGGAGLPPGFRVERIGGTLLVERLARSAEGESLDQLTELAHTPLAHHLHWLQGGVMAIRNPMVAENLLPHSEGGETTITIQADAEGRVACGLAYPVPIEWLRRVAIGIYGEERVGEMQPINVWKEGVPTQVPDRKFTLTLPL